MNLLPRLRWRLARWLAGVPILAEPLADDGAAILIRTGRLKSWVIPTTFTLELKDQIRGLDEYALGNYLPEFGAQGTFSGMVGEEPAE